MYSRTIILLSTQLARLNRSQHVNSIFAVRVHTLFTTHLPSDLDKNLRLKACSTEITGELYDIFDNNMSVRLTKYITQSVHRLWS